MHKGIAGAIGVAVLAAAGFGGLAAWQGSEVDAFHGKTIPLPGDVFEAKVSTQKLDFLHRGVLVGQNRFLRCICGILGVSKDTHG